jgi:predicted CoA-binding protein
MDLKRSGFDVVGVNPKYREIEGVSVYPTLADIPMKPDVAVFVVPSSVGVKLLTHVQELGIPRVWFQPGAEDDAVRSRISELGLTGSADGACIMVVRKRLGVQQ